VASQHSGVSADLTATLSEKTAQWKPSFTRTYSNTWSAQQQHCYMNESMNEWMKECMDEWKYLGLLYTWSGWIKQQPMDGLNNQSSACIEFYSIGQFW